MLDTQISKRRIIALIYDTYHIVKITQTIPSNLLTVEGVEGLVKDGLIPRDTATIIYKLMSECE